MRCGERMLAPRLERREALEQLALVVTGERHDLEHARPAVGERAGLVEGEGAQRGRHLEEGARP